MTGTLTAMGDVALLRLARRREDPSTASWLLLLTQTNWFLLYSGSRTLATTLETSLLLLALASYPHPRALGLAALGVMMRPTAALAWLPLALRLADKPHELGPRLPKSHLGNLPENLKPYTIS